MIIRKTAIDNTITLAPEGMIDTVNSAYFEEAVDAAVAETSTIIMDFGKVDYVSSSGLRILLKAQKKVLANNGNMTIINVNDSIKEVFELTGFAGIFSI